MVFGSRRPGNDHASHITDERARIGAITSAHPNSFDRLKFQVPNQIDQIEPVIGEPGPTKPSSRNKKRDTKNGIGGGIANGE